MSGLVDALVGREVERENVREFIVSTQLDRVRHFEGRLRDLGLSSAECLIVVLDVNDVNGRELAEILMPGYDWSTIRASGQTAFARGLVSRRGIQETLFGTEAGDELARVEGVAVLVMHRGLVTAFAISELVS